MKSQHQPILTEDGSPSLQTTYDNGVTEKMHHFRGALTESVYVYLPAIEWALARNPAGTCRVMSLGLGLGYNELLSLGAAVRSGQELRIITFELDPVLIDQFNFWLMDSPASSWNSIYDSILKLVADSLDLDPGDLKSAARQAVARQIWELRGAFPKCLAITDQFQAVLYDAFSAKMDEPLWRQEFLSEFLRAHAAPSCAFATYAATGALKRALKENGFLLEPKPGFGGKKECTFAIRSTP